MRYANKAVKLCEAPSHAWTPHLQLACEVPADESDGDVEGIVLLQSDTRCQHGRSDDGADLQSASSMLVQK